MPICSRCKTVKATEHFHRDKRRDSGIYPYCKACSSVLQRAQRAKHSQKYNEQRRQRVLNNPQEISAIRRKWRAKNKERCADYHAKKKYRVPYGTYSQMLNAQKGKCAICKSAAPRGKGRFHFDHCHDEGHVRGLLCHNCNVGIGNFQHDVAVLEAAIQYLAESAGKRGE
jgi:hypothetical protein